MTERSWPKPASWIAAVVVLAAVAAGITVLSRHHGSRPPAVIPTTTKPGDLISASAMPTLPGIDRYVRSARIVYRSTEGDSGDQTVVSGSVFLPRGDPPAGGWPVIALGHSTTGLDQPCAPSLSSTLLGNGKTVLSFVAVGYAVALPDYQGLGSPGVHPYLDARTAGYNMIDAVRALRSEFPDVSTTWGAFGGSQGGGAAWAADEQAATYAPELHLVGAAALAPAADATSLVDKAVAGTLTPDQRAAFQYVIESVARLHPEINRDDYRHGSAKADWDALSSCSGPKVKERDAALSRLGPFDLAPVDQAAADKLRFVLRQWSLPQQKVSAPLLVAYGGKDTFIDYQWTDGALARACALGGTVTRRFLPASGHADIDPAPELSWLLARFQGSPATNECP